MPARIGLKALRESGFEHAPSTRPWMVNLSPFKLDFMSQDFKVLFFLKKGKGSSEKSLPIYVRVTIDGKLAEWTVQRNCAAGLRWNQKLGRASGTKEEVKVLNGYLDAIQSNIFAIQRESTEEPSGHGNQIQEPCEFCRIIL